MLLYVLWSLPVSTQAVYRAEVHQLAHSGQQWKHLDLQMSAKYDAEKEVEARQWMQEILGEPLADGLDPNAPIGGVELCKHLKDGLYLARCVDAFKENDAQNLSVLRCGACLQKEHGVRERGFIVRSHHMLPLPLNLSDTALSVAADLPTRSWEKAR